MPFFNVWEFSDVKIFSVEATKHGYKSCCVMLTSLQYLSFEQAMN